MSEIKAPNRLVDLTEYTYEIRKNQEAQHIKFSKHLEIIQSKLPSWMRAKKDKRANGASFLNIIGLELDDVEFILDYAYKQAYIETIDNKQIYEAFKAVLPSSILPEHILKIYGDGIYDLEEAKNMIDFLTGLPDDSLQLKEVFYNNPYYIDWVGRIIYVRKPYGENKEYPEGVITIEVYQSNGIHIETHTLQLQYHHVWNFFDEFGFLLDTPRLYREDNQSYKRRILDVFRHPANSGEIGLRNGIARELSLVRYIPWKAFDQALPLRHPRIQIHTIEVNGERIPQEYIRKNRRGRIFIEPLPWISEEVTVSYVSGVEMHELHNKDDHDFQNELFSPEGLATPKLQGYVQQITDQVPTFWNHFKWDEGFWDIATADMSGYGMMPSYFDASIEGWEKYKKEK